MREEINLGIDIGGTKVNLGLMDMNGNVTDIVSMPVNKELSPEEFIASVCAQANHLAEKNGLRASDLNSIGVGVPGTVDHKTGFIAYCPNINLVNINAAPIFYQHLGANVRISQDSRLAAWAEHLFSSACLRPRRGPRKK